MKTLDAPVTLQLPLSKNLTSNFLKKEEMPTKVELSVKSDIMDSFENGWSFNGKNEITSIVHEKEGLVNFSISTDGRLYLIKKNKTGTEYWDNIDISAPIIDKLEAQNSDKKYEVVTFNAIHSGPDNNEGKSIAVQCCVAEVGNKANYEMWFTTSITYDQNEKSNWESLGKINDVTVEFMRMTRDPTSASSNDCEFTHVVCGKKKSNKYLTCYIYNSHKEEWIYRQLGYDIDNIRDLQFGNSSITPLGAYVLGTYKDKGRFFFVEIDSVNSNFKPGAIDIDNSLSNPTAFITVKNDNESHEYFGCSEVYLVDANNDNTNQIKFIGAESLACLDKEPKPNSNIINIGNSFKGSAKRIFATKNKSQRIDLYTHVIKDSNGSLLHIFNTNSNKNGENKWSPIYTLEKDISIIAPSSSVDDRICEIFIIGEKDNELRYLWQDDKLFAWNRDSIRVKAKGEAIATKCIQTKITFLDADTKNSILFQKYSEPLYITIGASKSVNTQINDKKYIISPKNPITIDAKELYGDLTLITNVTEADSPYYTINANFIANGEIVVHPVAKIQDRMKSVKKDEVQSPTDRFGDNLKINLVEGEKATDKYLNGVLPGVNELASYSGLHTFKNNLNLISNSPDISHMKREGVWVKDKSIAFNTRLDLSSVPDGVLFAINFDGESPKFLNSDECKLNGIKGLAGSNAYDGFWEDLAKFFGSFVQAVKNTFEKIVSFWVEKIEDVLYFTIKFLEETISCVVKYAEQLMDTINMVLIKYLGIDLSKIIQWLGAIFDFDYILKVQQYLANGITKTMDKIREGVNSAKTEVPKYFDIVKNAIDNGFPVFSDTSEQFKTALNNNDIEEVKKFFSTNNTTLEGKIIITKGQDNTWTVEDSKNSFKAKDEGNKLSISVSIKVPDDMKGKTLKDFKETSVDGAYKYYGTTTKERDANKKIAEDHQSSLKKDPVLTWGIKQFQNSSFSGFNALPGFNMNISIPDEITSFFKNTLEPLAEKSIGTLKTNIEDLNTYISDPNRTIFEIFEYLCKHIVDFGLDLAGQILTGILDIIEEMFKLFEEILTKEMDIPVLKSLYKLVCGSKATFSIVNAGALMLALPTTILCKLSGIKLSEVGEPNKKTTQEQLMKSMFKEIIRGSQSILFDIGIIANWTKASTVSIILGLISDFIIAPARLYVTSPFDLKGELKDSIASMVRWCVAIGNDLAHAVVDILDIFLKSAVLKLFYSFIVFCIFAIIDLVIFILKFIYGKLEGWKIADHILDFIQKYCDAAAKVYTCCGNAIINYTEPAEAIAKALIHALAMTTDFAGFGLQTIRAVGDTIDFATNQVNNDEVIAMLA
jgi:hypothetical protein